MFDGVSVTHVWDGSKLIVTSASGTSESDLRGPEGKRGPTGRGFEISKTYASVLQMHADYGNPAVPLYGFVLIDTGNVEDEDNAKLFVKQEDGYQFLIDMSGSEGIKGERGYSAYETAVKLGFIGSEDEWIASLKKPAEDAASEVRASEKVRESAENARIADENTRKLNEAAREDAEYHRRAISEDIVTRAENALTLANDAKAEAILSASAAGESERNARSSETAAESARLAAERARDDAEAIVGGDFASDADVSNQIYTHNTNATAHNDIRLLISGLTERLNTLANSDDTTLDQMAEVVAYIKANRDLISQITTNKVNVGDIVNDLATNVINKPLSAAQGVALKALIDAIKIPTTLPASDVYSWAKQPNKPSYSASEVGARPNTWTPSASDIGLKTENWTFALEDGSTITKDVYTEDGLGGDTRSPVLICKINNGISVIDAGLTYSRGMVEIRKTGSILWVIDSGVYNFTADFEQTNNRTVLQFDLPKWLSNKIPNVNGVYGGTGTIGYFPALAYENVTYTTFNCQSYLKRYAVGTDADTFQLVYTGLNAVSGGGLCGFHLKMPILLIEAEG